MPKIVIGVDRNGFEGATRLVVWGHDDLFYAGQRWIRCHATLPLVCEKAPGDFIPWLDKDGGAC